MVEVGIPWAWFGIAGATGGVLNAFVSHNVFLWPSRVAASARLRIVRPGLLLNLIIGALAGVGALCAFTGVAAITTTIVSVESFILALVGAVSTGTLAARWITNEADKRLLRVALSHACAAPAAHPDTARAMEVAPPYEVFELASTLEPRFRSFR